MRVTEIGAMVVLRPDAARERLREAHAAAGGVVRRTAAALGISARCWHLYVRRLGLDLPSARGGGPGRFAHRGNGAHVAQRATPAPQRTAPPRAR